MSENFGLKIGLEGEKNSKNPSLKSIILSRCLALK